MSKPTRPFACLLLIGLFASLNAPLDAQPTATAEVTPTSEAADKAFWDSVYNDNHVLDIQIRLTREAWNTMQPEGGGAGQGGFRPGGPGNGRPPGPPRGRGFRPPSGFGPPPQQHGGGGPPGQGGPPRGPGGSVGPPPGAEGETESEYTYVKSELIVDGQKFSDSGLRFKGNSSYRFSAGGLKRPLKIDTDRFVDDQELHGRTKLNLSNSSLDSAFMKEKLGYELYRAAGLPTPGVGWANVTLSIDGRKTPLGIYVVIEQVDSRYIVSHQGSGAKGSLLMKPESVGDWPYLGDDPEAYAGYNIKQGAEDAEQINRFAELLQLIEQASDAEFEAEIAERMDLPMLAGYLAATSLLGSVDSYIGGPHNCYLLLDRTDGKLRMLPWDVNEGFGTFTMGASVEQLVDWDVDRPWIVQRRLLERLFETKSFPELYRSALSGLMDDFTEEKLFARIKLFENAIKPFVGKYKAGPGTKGLQLGIKGDRSGYNTAVDRPVLAIKPFITRRAISVKAQLAGERDGVKIEGRRRR